MANPDEQLRTEMLEELDKSEKTVDATRLELALEEAVVDGLPEELLGKYRRLAVDLTSKAFLNRMLGKTISEAEAAKEPSAEALLKLYMLSRQLRRVVGISAKMTQSAVAAAQSQARRRMDIFNPRADLRPVADLIFGELRYFANLRSVQAEQGVEEGQSLDAIYGDLLSYSDGPLKQPLTKLPPDQAEKALETFHHLVTFMADRPGATLALSSCMDIVSGNQDLKDELYCQIMKQMNLNSEYAMVVKGWHALCLLSEKVKPSERLLPFAQAFVRRAVPDPNKATRRSQVLDAPGVLAKQCLNRLVIPLEVPSSPRVAPSIIRTRVRAMSATAIARRKVMGMDSLASVPLLKFRSSGGSETAYLDPLGLGWLNQLPESATICPIVFMGDGRSGKSFLASKFLGKDDVFHSAEAAEAVTEGIDMAVCPAKILAAELAIQDEQAEQDYLLVLDCESGDSARAAIRTLVNVSAILLGRQMVYVTSDIASETSLKNLDQVMGAKRLIKLGESGSQLEPADLVFCVNFCSLLYEENSLKAILDKDVEDERRAVRANLKAHFPTIGLCTIPLISDPDFDSKMETFRRTVFHGRRRFTYEGSLVKAGQLRGFLEVAVEAFQAATDAQSAAVRKKTGVSRMV